MAERTTLWRTNPGGQNRPIITNALQKSCKGGTAAGSPPITEIFRRQSAKASQSEGSHTPANTQAKAPSAAEARLPTEPQPPSVDPAFGRSSESASPLVPRQLTYSEAPTSNTASDLTNTQFQKVIGLTEAFTDSTLTEATGHDTQPATANAYVTSRRSSTQGQKARRACTVPDRPRGQI